ncbi:MAG: hypothetical protein CMD16_00720 [Flavobacteriales bacterium]|nr:hypothetical protein [Flavobacteriales bacterium]
MKKLLLILLCLPFIGFGQISGCTDSVYCNYNANATIDDGTCTNYCGCDALLMWQDDYCTGFSGYINVTSSGWVMTHCYDWYGVMDEIYEYVFISNSTAGSSSISSCNSYTWNGNLYTTSGSYTDTTYTNVNGCDSTATLNLTINESDSTSTFISSCNSYTWDGIVYTNSGAYTNTYSNINSCDSLHTLNLNINTSPNTSIILGNTQVNYLSIETYNVAQNIGSTFNWYLNSGGIIISGQNTNSIQVQWGNNSGNYDLYIIETDSSGCVGDSVNINISINSVSIIENINLSKNKNLIKVTDLLGREAKQTNQPLLYLYDDGTVEKRITID